MTTTPLSTEVLLTTDPGIVVMLIVVWTWAALGATGLPYAATPRSLHRRAGRLLILAGVGLALAAARVVTTGLLGGAGWWFVQEKVLLALPLLLPAVAVVVVLAIPRLVAVRRAATTLNGVNTMAPGLRQSAAHPWIAWPFQLAAVASAAGLLIVAFVSYPVTAGSALALLSGLGLVAAATWRWLVARHTRLGADVIIPSRAARLARGGAVVTGLTVAGVTAPLFALVATAPAAGAHADAGHGVVDLGGGSGVGAGVRGVSVTELGTRTDGPVRRFTITARHTRLSLPSGSTVDVLAFDRTVPGPELRVAEGDLVEVTLHNADVAEGVTIHWHGYDVPAREDGVAGVTQDAVGIGGEFVYRFRADQVGTFWYHSHQRSNEQVTAGLYGLLVVQPREPAAGLDLPVPYHRFPDGTATLLGSDRDSTLTVATGTPVRLRLVNAANDGVRFAVRGAEARLVAIDGGELSGPTLVTNPAVRVGAGSRADLSFTMPAGPVWLESNGPSLVLTPDGRVGTPQGTVSEVDPFHYGTPARTPFNATSHFDRHFTLVFDNKFTRVEGTPSFAYAVNGRAYPEVPPQLVRFGELVRFTIVARGYEAHPMHPHGHHVLVLSRNGAAPTGSPLWLDTFEVRPGDVWEVALRADNPGIWMDHCHNLRHAAGGMMFHLAYDGVQTPYRMSGINHPE